MGNNKSTVSTGYVFIIGISSFVLAVLFFWISQLVAEKVESYIASFIFLFVIILIGIIADIVGTSVAAASEAPLHAKAAKKVAGAQEGVYLIRNADRVANIANDVVGDIAGTVSGALGIALVIQLVTLWDSTSHLHLFNMLITALIASFTVIGKALGKKIALSYPDKVIFTMGRFLAGFEKTFGFNPVIRKAKRNTYKRN